MTVAKRIKITHIITGLNTGGAERALYNLLASNFRAKYDCSVISLIDEGTYAGKIRALGVPVYAINMRVNFSIFYSIMLLREVIRKLAPEIIQGWMYHGNLAAILAQFLCDGLPVLVWNIRHSLYEIKSEKFLTRQIIKINCILSGKVDTIIYNSNVSRLQHEHFGFESSHSFVNPNGFDTDLLRPSLEKGEVVRSAIGISRDSTVIGHVARYHPMKDHVGFIKAMIMVMSKQANLEVLVIGREVRAETAFLLHELPETIISRFHFLGERSDVYDLMQSMDILCLSSAWGEGFPNVLGEAMSMAVPCITTDIAESAEVVGETGIVVPPCEPEKLADAVFRFLKLTSTQRAEKGRAARRRIEEKYLMEVNIKCYEAIYAQLFEYWEQRQSKLDISK